MPQSIVVIGSPRSGTSAVCAVLDAHGVWHDKIGGRNRWDTRPGNYCSFEWRDMKQTIKPQGFGTFEGYAIPEPTAATKRAVTYLVFRDVPKKFDYWLFKGVPEFVPGLLHLDPIIVSVYRNRDDCVASQMKRGTTWTLGKHHEVWDRRADLCEQYVTEHAGYYIDMDEVILEAKVEENFRPLIENMLGIEWNLKAALDALVPDRWTSTSR